MGTTGRAESSFELAVLLNIEPVEADHATLRDILGRNEWNSGPGSEWKLAVSPTPESALEAIREHRIPVLFCEGDSYPGLWQRVLEELPKLPNPPYLIVTSRLADDRLWAEALNLGAYDVLAKPFDRSEVNRIVNSAWLRWHNRQATSARRMAGAA